MAQHFYQVSLPMFLYAYLLSLVVIMPTGYCSFIYLPTIILTMCKLMKKEVPVKSFICPTNARLNCFKMLKFTLKITINAPTCFGLTKTIIREPTACASPKLQYWCQLKYFVIELFGRVAAYAATRPNSSITKYFNWHQYCNFCEAQTVSSLMMVFVKPKHVGAFIVNF